VLATVMSPPDRARPVSHGSGDRGVLAGPGYCGTHLSRAHARSEAVVWSLPGI